MIFFIHAKKKMNVFKNILREKEKIENLLEY